MNHPTPDVTAVIVTYNPEPKQFLQCLERLESQVCKIIIVDNNSLPEIRDLIQQSAFTAFLIWIQNDNNAGLAEAQATGISHALSTDTDYVLLLDQDSLPDEGMVSKLLQCYLYLGNKGVPVAGVGPKVIQSENGAVIPFATFHYFQVKKWHCHLISDTFVISDFLISSGLLCHVSIYRNVGLPDGSYFIDNIDMDWCFRARALGYKLYGACQARLNHQIGSASRYIRFFNQLVGPIYVHEPLRTYYQTRNRIRLYRKSYTPWSWIVQDIPRALFKLFFFSLFITPRLEYFSMMFLGIKHGFAGKAGRLI